MTTPDRSSIDKAGAPDGAAGVPSAEPRRGCRLTGGPLGLVAGPSPLATLDSRAEGRLQRERSLPAHIRPDNPVYSVLEVLRIARLALQYRDLDREQQVRQAARVVVGDAGRIASEIKNAFPTVKAPPLVGEGELKDISALEQWLTYEVAACADVNIELESRRDHHLPCFAEDHARLRASVNRLNEVATPGEPAGTLRIHGKIVYPPDMVTDERTRLQDAVPREAADQPRWIGWYRPSELYKYLTGNTRYRRKLLEEELKETDFEFNNKESKALRVRVRLPSSRSGLHDTLLGFEEETSSKKRKR